MQVPRFVVCTFWIGVMVLGAAGVPAQNYPNKPVRIVAAQAGGGNDFVARLVAQGLTGRLGQQVVVDNRGVLAGEIVAKAAPDGYTLLFYGNPVWLAPFLRDNVPYDPVRDFSPITWATNSFNVLAVHSSVPARSVKELIALAKARPGELNYSSGITGAATHLEGELFRVMAGINIVRVPYKGNGPALNALVSGEVHLTFANPGTLAPHVKSGRLRALAVTSAQPTGLAPGLPPVAASVPGYESVLIMGIFAPARTPATLIDRLNQEIVRVLNTAGVKERLFKSGVEVVGTSPEQFAAKIRSEMAKWGKMIKEGGMHE